MHIVAVLCLLITTLALPVAAFPGILFVNSRFIGAPRVYVRSNA
jgi:hypothetical protein